MTREYTFEKIKQCGKCYLFLNEIINKFDFPEERKGEFARTFSRLEAKMKSKW